MTKECAEQSRQGDIHADEDHIGSGEILVSADDGCVPRDRSHLGVGGQRPGLQVEGRPGRQRIQPQPVQGQGGAHQLFHLFLRAVPIHQELKGQGFQTLGVGLSSSKEQLQQIVTQLGLAYPVLEGNDGVSKAYGGVELVPLTFIIDKQGNIAHKVLGARSKEEFEKMVKPLL
jgi:hypothetical protein